MSKQKVVKIKCTGCGDKIQVSGLLMYDGDDWRNGVYCYKCGTHTFKKMKDTTSKE